MSEARFSSGSARQPFGAVYLEAMRRARQMLRLLPDYVVLKSVLAEIGKREPLQYGADAYKLPLRPRARFAQTDDALFILTAVFARYGRTPTVSAPRQQMALTG